MTKTFLRQLQYPVMTLFQLRRIRLPRFVPHVTPQHHLCPEQPTVGPTRLLYTLLHSVERYRFVLGRYKRLDERVVDDAHLVADALPHRRHTFLDRQIPVVRVPQTHDVRREVLVQERLLRVVVRKARLDKVGHHRVE